MTIQIVKKYFVVTLHMIIYLHLVVLVWLLLYQNLIIFDWLVILQSFCCVQANEPLDNQSSDDAVSIASFHSFFPLNLMMYNFINCALQ